MAENDNSADRMEAAAAAPESPGIGRRIRRALRNAAWLLGGKSVGGVFSLVYLGLAARTLGVDEFGAFALTLAFGQAVAGIAQFQTADVMINYGARHLEDRAADRFSRVLTFSALLDAASAAACAIIAAASVLLLGEALGLSPDERLRTAAFGASFLFSLRGTPIGVLRLLDRFDIAAASETVLPACRLAAAAACYFLAPSVAGFLIAWALAEFATTVVIWISALLILRKRRLAVGLGKFRYEIVMEENRGVWRFAWFTNLTSSVAFLWQQAPTLAVGWGVGAGPAGGFRIAQQLAQSLSKPVVSLSRAIFPEFTQLAIRHGGGAVAKFASRISTVAAIAGAIAVALVALFGKEIITLVVGADYAFADKLFLLLTIAAAIEFWGVGQEPALMAMNRAGLVFAARATMGLAFLVLLIALLLMFGATGAAVAAVISRLAYRIVTTILLHRASR